MISQLVTVLLVAAPCGAEVAITERTPPFRDLTFSADAGGALEMFEYPIPSTFEKGSEQTGAQDNELEKQVAVVFGGLEEGAAWMFFFALFILCHCVLWVVCCGLAGLCGCLGGAYIEENLVIYAGRALMGCALIPVVALIVALIGALAAIAVVIVLLVVLFGLAALIGALWVFVLVVVGGALLLFVDLVNSKVGKNDVEEDGMTTCETPKLVCVAAVATLVKFVFFLMEFCIWVAVLSSYDLMPSCNDGLETYCDGHTWVVKLMEDTFPGSGQVSDMINVEPTFAVAVELQDHIAMELNWGCSGFKALVVSIQLVGAMMALCFLLHKNAPGQLAHGLAKARRERRIIYLAAIQVALLLLLKLVDLMTVAGSSGMRYMVRVSEEFNCSYHGDVTVSAIGFGVLLISVCLVPPCVYIVLIQWKPQSGVAKSPFAGLSVFVGVWMEPDPWAVRFKSFLESETAIDDEGYRSELLLGYISISMQIFASSLQFFPLGPLAATFVKAINAGDVYVWRNSDELPLRHLSAVAMTEKIAALVRFGLMLTAVFSLEDQEILRVLAFFFCIVCIAVESTCGVVLLRDADQSAADVRQGVNSDWGVQWRTRKPRAPSFYRIPTAYDYPSPYIMYGRQEPRALLEAPSVTCNGCGLAQLAPANRYKCRVCVDYDLCGRCYAQRHEIHPFHSTWWEPSASQVQTTSPPQAVAPPAITDQAPVAEAAGWGLSEVPVVTCDGCGLSPVEPADRYKCRTCCDYDLCRGCYASRDGIHPEHSTWWEPTAFQAVELTEAEHPQPVVAEHQIPGARHDGEEVVDIDKAEEDEEEGADRMPTHEGSPDALVIFDDGPEEAPVPADGDSEGEPVVASFDVGMRIFSL